MVGYGYNCKFCQWAEFSSFLLLQWPKLPPLLQRSKLWPTKNVVIICHVVQGQRQHPLSCPLHSALCGHKAQSTSALTRAVLLPLSAWKDEVDETDSRGGPQGSLGRCLGAGITAVDSGSVALPVCGPAGAGLLPPRVSAKGSMNTLTGWRDALQRVTAELTLKEEKGLSNSRKSRVGWAPSGSGVCMCR